MRSLRIIFLFYRYCIMQRNPTILHKKSPPGCMVLQTPEGFIMFYTPQETSLIRVKQIKVSASLLAHNQITALQFISRSCTPPDTSKSPPSTYCFWPPAEDFLASVNLFSGRNGFCCTPCRIVFLSTHCPVCTDPHVISLSRT